jgi:hypothetical protein
MKKIIALFGSLLIFAGTKSKAQNPTQVPVKKETVKPDSGTAPKADAVDAFLKLGTLKGEKTAPGAKGVNPTFKANDPTIKATDPTIKAANPTFKGANPAVIKTNPTLKPAQSAPSQQVAPRHTPPPTTGSVAPRHKG